MNDADRIKDYIYTHMKDNTESKFNALMSIHDDKDDGIYIYQHMMTSLYSRRIVYLILFDISLIIDTKPLKELIRSISDRNKRIPPIYSEFFVNDFPLILDDMYTHDMSDCLTVCADLFNDYEGFMKLTDIFLHKYSKNIMYHVYTIALQNIQNIEFKSILLKLITEYNAGKEGAISL